MFDVHAHFVPSVLLDWLKEHADDVDATWEQRAPDKEPFLMVGRKWAFELKREFYDSARFMAAQDAAGVVHSLVSPIPQLFLYDADPAVTTEAADLYNRALAAWVQAHPERLSGLATLPLNDPVASADGLRTALQLGLKGAIIGPGLGTTLLSDPRFIPVWEEADAQAAILFVHPLLNQDPRIQRNMMPNLIGVPWESTVCALDLVLSGMMDRYPNVRILLAHGGGFLPYQVGRLNQGYASWPAIRTSLQARPEEYLRRFWYDNVLWHDAALQMLRDVAGVDKVLPGSDFPFDLSAWPPAHADLAACRTFLGLSGL